MGLHDGKSERDLLIELCTDMKWMKGTVSGVQVTMSDHLKDHTTARLAWWTCIFSAAIAVGCLIIQILK